jgi:hypothetical protein
MAEAAAIIALSERLRKQSRKARNSDVVSDLRLATLYLRALAVLKIEEEAEVAIDPVRKQQLKQEAAQLQARQILPWALETAFKRNCNYCWPML